ncbi:hypothetical protein HU200_034469 [Digitaria exilis]|uniref:Barwin domain-containing protein n=1 Tax=Digitaria exilis TaxID=1010633 RepID=A0A835BPR3_9POAL|nr:hypothetical protein HU200_034469 [Digitaria exilis]CAB3491891.1 unnamed protein product [Digitaria exilis]
MSMEKHNGSVRAMLLAPLLVALAVVAAGGGGVAAQHASGVTAMVTPYSSAVAWWDLRAVGAYCATWDADKPLIWRQKYYWAAFCGPVGPQDDASCALCIRVTNDATGAQVTVRILDKCAFGGLGLDPPAFQEIDTDGHGAVNGKLSVSYEYVDCQD